MKDKNLVYIKLFFFFFGLLLIIPPSLFSKSRPYLVSSTGQIADFAKNITGDRWEVISILTPGADPHIYIPTPKDAELVAKADLILQNGLNLEGKNWMANLAEASGKTPVNCTRGIKAIEIKEGSELILDPHAWFSPENAVIYVKNILNALCEIDPENQEEYRARAELYIRKLASLDQWIRAQLYKIPPEERILVSSHDAFNYFCLEYRFNPENNYLSIAPSGWSTGNELGAGNSPAKLKSLMEDIRASGVKAVFLETSVNPKQMNEIAREAGIRVGGLLYSDAMGAKGTAAEDYIGMMRENTLTIIRALK